MLLSVRALPPPTHTHTSPGLQPSKPPGSQHRDGTTETQEFKVIEFKASLGNKS